MKCSYREIECTELDTSDMTKIECNQCIISHKRYAMIASLPEREEMLRLTVESLRPQVDQIFVTLNNYKVVPDFLIKEKVVILDNKMGDAGKFWFVKDLKGYLLTCDDDLIYPLGYVDYMISGVEKYKCPCSLHGRDYSRPVIGFQQDFRGYPCLGDVLEDTQVDVGGDGVMCWHSDTLKISYEDFKQKNMSQLYFSKLCKEQDVPIIVLAHKKGYLGYMNPSWTIWEEENKSNFVRQTALLKEFLK